VNKLGFTVPKSTTFTNGDNEEEIVKAIGEEIGFPAVLKLLESDGCEGLNLVKNEEQAKDAIAKFARYKIDAFIAQELVQGVAASVTLVSNGVEAQPITLNKQDISIKAPEQNSSYNGGATPYRHKQIRAAFAAAKSLVESIPGLTGYVGVDIVLTENAPVIMEINPRLTTSYVGIREIMQTNVMQMIVNSILNHMVPEPQKTMGFACFGKIKMSNPTFADLRQIFDMPEVISPPFPVYSNNQTFALACTKGATTGEARQEFNRKKKQLRNTVVCRGKTRR
jgi:predicted ATP-grasp superfamily ATP-dependent carboligase